MIYYVYFSKNSYAVADSAWPITCQMCDVAVGSGISCLPQMRVKARTASVLY